jgi:hypothetical protein
MPSALNEQRQALVLTAALANAAGGDAAGMALLTAVASETLSTATLCPDLATRSDCLARKAYQACAVDRNPMLCREYNILIGSAQQKAVDIALENSRKSAIDAYFLQPTYVSIPRNVHRDVAAVSVAAKTAAQE